MRKEPGAPGEISSAALPDSIIECPDHIVYVQVTAFRHCMTELLNNNYC